MPLSPITELSLPDRSLSFHFDTRETTAALLNFAKSSSRRSSIVAHFTPFLSFLKFEETLFDSCGENNEHGGGGTAGIEIELAISP